MDYSNQPRWQRRKDARPAEIIEAALTLFVEKGFAATKLDDVAKLAGVTKGTVYLYFENKEELLKSAVRETVLPTLTLAEATVAQSQADAVSLLRLLLDKWTETMKDPRISGITKLIIAEAANFPELGRFYVEEVVTRTRKLIAGLLEKGMAAGQIRRVDLDLLTREIFGPLLLANIWKHSFAAFEGELVDMGAMSAFHFDVLLNGIRA